MNTDLMLILALLGAAIVMFVRNRPRMDAVGLIMIVAMPLTGVVSIRETTAGGDEVRVIVLIMVSTALLGIPMGSTGVVALFVPIAQRIAQSAGIPPGRIMMTLAYAALTSGMPALVATPVNLVINTELARQNIGPFGFFGITPFGVPFTVVAMIVAVVMVPLLLPFH